MSFWTDPGDIFRPFAEPKRPYRYIVRINNFRGGTFNATRAHGLPEYLWYAINCDKPAFNIEVSEHRLNNRIYKFPKNVTWEDVTITMVDTDCPSLAELLGRYLEDAGGPGVLSDVGLGIAGRLNIDESESNIHPVNHSEINTTVTKQSAVSSLGLVNIYQIDTQGRPLEKWTLHGAFIRNVNWGKLDYGDQDFMNVTITLAYDWASVSVGSRDMDSGTTNNDRMHPWSNADVEGIISQNHSRFPSLQHFPNGRGYEHIDADGDGRPDFLESYIDSFTDNVVEENEGESEP